MKTSRPITSKTRLSLPNPAKSTETDKSLQEVIDQGEENWIRENNQALDIIDTIGTRIASLISDISFSINPILKSNQPKLKDTIFTRTIDIYQKSLSWLNLCKQYADASTQVLNNDLKKIKDNYAKLKTSPKQLQKPADLNESKLFKEEDEEYTPKPFKRKPAKNIIVTRSKRQALDNDPDPKPCNSKSMELFKDRNIYSSISIISLDREKTRTPKLREKKDFFYRYLFPTFNRPENKIVSKKHNFLKILENGFSDGTRKPIEFKPKTQEYLESAEFLNIDIRRVRTIEEELDNEGENWYGSGRKAGRKSIPKKRGLNREFLVYRKNIEKRKLARDPFRLNLKFIEIGKSLLLPKILTFKNRKV